MNAHRPRTTRTLAVATLALAASLTPLSASAQPPGDTSDAMERYQELGAQAAKADEDMLQAEEELAGKQRERDEADAALAEATRVLDAAKREEQRFRDEADELTGASFQSGRVSRWNAVLTSDSRRDFLDRMSALGVLADNNEENLTRLSAITGRADAARSTAAEARRAAGEATTAARKAVDELERRRQDLDGQIADVRQALGALSDAEQVSLQTVQDNGSYAGPPGAANDALQAALSMRGSAYEWGAEGPSTFDCSGLTSWAYAQAGVDIPRTSRQQWFAGRAVSLDALVPGDLLFYDDGTGNPDTIHHVGMYVGNGKMVDAPTEGQVVDVRSMEGDGHLIGARRIAG
ncbi:Cell wall-associated hydrolase, NlpC family [Prauserella marina]|uniref:Cell wall-associated hydrolase, NlpC family n=1 Tax=Prauserella marina TaxID=530584 RepID=A0A1G6JZ20_9PSEU|nr:C40 family peptidase [Prauserella marina]PWV84388.1 cell wall-associated NlpC family hydrolase [Prauserella marina]SDC23831.1 Cell wall-associated hydrolase, NlpC family [Prauserella marina]